MSYCLHDVDENEMRDMERLAAMFNDFDSAWPGGFNRGMDDTPERLQKDMRRRKRLAVLTVEHESGEFVGFCNLEAQAGQKDLAYVPLLGARLSHHGQGVGKMLLREMVRRVTELGYAQLTLHTWPGNTKAVPLYKKTGFNWVPETDVFMRNYLPTALTLPAGKAFFAGRDWYECLERDIVVAPDDVKWNGMKVYPYQFRSGEEFLSLVFDAHGHGLTAIETNAYAVACSVPVEEAAAGETFPITWEIASRDGKPLEVVLLTEAESGLDIRAQERFVVEGEKTLTRELRVAPDAAPRRGGENAHRVRSTLLLNGQPVVLETGVKVVRPVEIRYGGQGLFTGRQEKITVTLQSNLERPLTGQLSLDAHPALVCDTPTQEFSLPPRHRTQCTFYVTAQEAGAHPTRLTFAAGETKGERPVTFRAFRGAEAAASVDADYAEQAILETPGLRVETNLRGGHLSLTNTVANRGLMGHPLAELGPPYVEEILREPLYSARAENTPGETQLVLTAPSTESPGLTVERSVAILGGDLTRVDYRVYNTTGEPISTKLRVQAYVWLNAQVILPTPQGLLREPLGGWGDFPMGDIDALAHGAKLTESWAACEEEGLMCGLVWTGDPEQNMTWSRFPNLTYDLGELPPHSVRAIPSVYLVGGYGSWETARGWWRRLAQPSGIHEEHSPETSRLLEVRSEPSPALLMDAQADVNITVLNRRGRKLSGALTLQDKAFQATGEPRTLEGVDRDNPFTATVQVTAPGTPSAGFLTAELDTETATETFRLPILRLGVGGSVSLKQEAEGVIVADNGLLTLRIAPEFLGSLIALEREGVNHLFSAYPKARPYEWTNPWYGGVHPFLGWHSGDPRLTREKFTGELCERIGERGLRWQGARVVCQPEHKNLRWLRVEAEYLTLPGSNVVALVSRWTNGNTARAEEAGGVAAWLQVGGTRENSIAHYERANERRHRRRGSFSAEARSGSWAAVENPETNDVFLLIAASQGAHVSVDDKGKEGPHLQTQGSVSFAPGETKEVLTWLVLSKEKSQIEAYAALSQMRRLP